MARQTYFVNTTTKNFDVEGSFGGGMVMQSHPEKLRADQSILIENGDILIGGVVQSRGGYQQTNAPSPSLSGNTQGYFHYNNLAGGQDIVAINGHLYTISGSTYTLLTISGMSSFQSARPIEAVQYRDKMYIATGSGIVIYDGVSASAMVAYAPSGLEALYIGTNGYAANPDNYLSDILTGNADIILGVDPDQRYGVLNKNITFTAYIEQVAGDVLEYLWEVKNVVSADYPTTPEQNWSTNKTWVGNFSATGNYMVRCSMRKQGTTTVLSQYVLPRYTIQMTPDENPEEGVNFSNLSTCNRILVHYDRLMMYGDTSNPDFLYVSHLENFNYWPRTNLIKVTDPLRGGLQSVNEFRSYLIAFTNGSIQMILGDSPSNYSKQNVHTSLGTNYPYSVQVMRNNYLIFAGSDNLIYILKPIRSTSLMMDVQRIDDNIRDVVKGQLATSTKVLSTVYNVQYYMYVETSSGNFLYRYYYDMDIWVRDNTTLQFATLATANNLLVSTSKAGAIVYKLSPTVFKDGVNTTYNLQINSKDFDFDMPHHRKKLKQFQILADMTALTTLTVKIYVDNTLLSTTNLPFDTSQNTDAQKLKIMASGRFRYTKFQLTVPVNELVQIIGYAFVFKLNTPK